MDEPASNAGDMEDMEEEELVESSAFEEEGDEEEEGRNAGCITFQS